MVLLVIFNIVIFAKCVTFPFQAVQRISPACLEKAWLYFFYQKIKFKIHIWLLFVVAILFYSDITIFNKPVAGLPSEQLVWFCILKVILRRFYNCLKNVSCGAPHNNVFHLTSTSQAVPQNRCSPLNSSWLAIKKIFLAGRQE